MLGAAIGAGEEGVFAREGNRPNGSLDHVVVDFDAAVLEKQAQACPARQGIADGFGELGLLADQRQFLTQPGLECLDQRKAALLPNSVAILGGAAADLALDPVERGNARQGFGGDRRGAALGEFVKVPTDMAPAEGKLHIAPFGQHLVAGIAVDL